MLVDIIITSDPYSIVGSLVILSILNRNSNETVSIDTNVNKYRLHNTSASYAIFPLKY